ncbi:two pore calcium channel protein 1-like, partial [Trifolium medium]|nr:two pore calcium channel protein 1-like [Trifolium medium]
TLPKISKEEFELIFDELDDTHDVKINKDEFADICNAIALRFQKEDVSSYFDYLVFYHSSTSKRLKAFVKSTMFGYIVTFVLILNLVAVIIETTSHLI